MHDAFESQKRLHGKRRASFVFLDIIASCPLQNGGGIYYTNSKGDIRNTLFQGNKASEGSAILLSSSRPEVTGCLFDGEILRPPLAELIMHLTFPTCHKLSNTVPVWNPRLTHHTLSYSFHTRPGLALALHPSYFCKKVVSLLSTILPKQS